MISRIDWKDHSQTFAEEKINEMACLGLRTLILAKRPLEEADCDFILHKSKELENLSDPSRKQSLDSLFSKFETDLTYVGITAIEDKLQEDLEPTISLLMSANIKFWVLTGDKPETALEIAKSC